MITIYCHPDNFAAAKEKYLKDVPLTAAIVADVKRTGIGGVIVRTNATLPRTVRAPTGEQVPAFFRKGSKQVK